MKRRHFPRRRVVVALIAVALAFSVFSSSAATLGGLGPDVLGGASGLTKHVTAVQLEWNRSENTTPAQLTQLRLTAGTGETFSTRDVVDVTAAGAGAVACSTQTTVSKDTATVDLSFPSCALMLWELSSVAVNISGTQGATTLESNIGVLNAGLSSFDGAVVQPDAPLFPAYTTAGKGRAESLATVSLGVGDATVEQLVDRRAVVVLSNPKGQTTSYVADVGTRTSNQGIWAEIDPTTSVPTVTAELSKLVAGGASPTTADVAQFRMVLLQPQRLGAGQAPTNQYALTTAAGTIESTGGGGEVVDVSSAVEPVGLDDRLTVKGKYSQQQDDISLRFCYQFDVKNVSTEAVEWQLVFDTTQPPMWGLNPGIVQEGAVGALHSKWSFETVSYQQGSGLWTVGGVSWNKVLAPKASTTVGYCAQPEVPVLDTTRFDAPEISLKSGKKPDYVEFRVKVKSSFDYLVPWEAEVDLADYVCPASLPETLSGQNSVLTKIEGSRYRVRGTDNTYRFVSAKKKQDFVFLGFNPVSDPFAPGC